MPETASIEIKGKVEQILKDLGLLEKQLEAVEKAAKKISSAGGVKVGDGADVQKLTKRVQRLERQLKRARAAMDRMRTAGAGIAKTFRAARAAVIGFGGALAVRQLTRFLQAAVEVKRVFDGIENTLKAVTDTTAEYQRAQSLVLQTAQRLGLQVTKLGQDYSLLLASTRDIALSQRDIEEAFIAVSEAGRVLNLSNERVQLTFLALSQIASKGIACVDEKCQILTRDGWKHHVDLAIGEVVAGINLETGESEWQELQDVVVFEPGEKQLVEAVIGGRPIVMTEDHRCVVYGEDGLEVHRANSPAALGPWPVASGWEEGLPTFRKERPSEITLWKNSAANSPRVWCPRTPLNTWICRDDYIVFATNNTMEELRRQLGDQLPGVLPGVAKALNLTTAELIELVRQGRLTAEEVIPAITAAAQDLAGGQVQAAARTLAASIGRLSTEAQLAQRRFIDVAEDGLIPLAEAMAKVIREEQVADALGRMTAAAAISAQRSIEAANGWSKFSDAVANQGDSAASAAEKNEALSRLISQQFNPFSGLTRLYEEAGLALNEWVVSTKEGTVAAKETALANERLGITAAEAAERQAKAADEIAETGQRLIATVTDSLRRIEEARFKAGVQEVVEARKRQAEIKQIVEETTKTQIEAEQLTARERLRIVERLKRNRVIAELNAADDIADTFDFLERTAADAAQERLKINQALNQRLVELEITLGDDVAAALDKALEKTKLSGEQRLEAQEELSKKLLEIEQDRLDKLEEANRDFTEGIAEGGEREEAETKLAEKLLEIEKAAIEARVDAVEAGVEDIIKAEEKRVEAAEKVAQKIIDLEAKILEARRKSAEEARELFDELEGGFEEPSADGTTKRLADLRKELAELQGKTILDPGDFERIDELRSQIFEVARGAQLAQESFRDFSEDLQVQSDAAAEKINDFLSSSNFQTAFQDLSAAERAALLPLIQNFETAAANANLNQQRVGELEGALRDLGLVGESATSGIADQLRNLAESPTGAVQKLDELKQKAQELGGASEQAAAPLERIDKAVAGIAASGEGAGAAAASIGAGFAENQGAITAAGDALDLVSQATPALASDLDAIAEALPGLLESIKTATDEGSVKALAADIQELATQTEAAKGGFETLIAGIEAILGAAERKEEVSALKDALVELSNTSEALGKVAVSLESIATALGEVVTGAGKVKEALGKAQTALATFETFIDDTAIPAIGRLNDALGSIITRLGEVEGAFFDLRKTSKNTFDEIISDVARAAAALGQLQEQMQGVREDGDDLLDSDLGPATSPAGSGGGPLAGAVGPVQPGSQAGQPPPP